MKFLLYTNLMFIVVYLFSFFYVDKLKDETILEKQELVATKMTVKLFNNNIIENIDLEEYIIGVIACEMPASFEKEALKANAVAARTYAMKKMNENNIYDLENSTNNQCYIDNNEMKEKWKENYDYYYNRIKEAVTETKGEYITYNNELITAFYFSTSNGYTEDSENVFLEKLEYLRSTESQWDIETPSFLKETTFTIEEFTNLLNLQEKTIENINILSKFPSGRINEIKVNNKVLKGTEFRKLLSIRSTDFEIIKNESNIIIKTKGFGHGVGLSQYGANEMAKLNYTYDEILKHYYKGIEIKNV